MEDKNDLQQKLQDLVRLREQIVDQIGRAHGTLSLELKKMLGDVDAEIVKIQAQIGD